jgi:hypothetical protein
MGVREAQRTQIMKLHKPGRSSCSIAENLTLSRRTVTTVIGKADRTDRVINQRRKRLGLTRNRTADEPRSHAAKGVI